MHPHTAHPFIERFAKQHTLAFSRVTAVWRWLTTPTFSGHNVETHTAARLLMLLLIIIALLTVLLSSLMEPAARALPDHRWNPLRDAAITLVAIGISYVIARRGRIDLAIGFTIAISIIGIVLISLPQVMGSVSALAYLYLLIVPVTYASIFLSLRATFLTTLGAAGGAAVAYVISTGRLSTEYMLFLSFLVIAAVVCMVGTQYRALVERSRSRELSESAARLRLITDTISETILIANGAGIIEYVSTASFRVSNVAPDEVIGLHIGHPRFVALRHPEDNARVEAAMKQAIANVTPTVIEYRVLSPANVYVWLEISMNFLCDARGALTHIIIVGRDVSDRKRAELDRLDKERLSADLHRELELNAIREQLMQRLSHEFRTPLTLLQTSAELLNRYGDRMTPEQRVERFTRINDSVAHMNTMLIGIMDAVDLQAASDSPTQRIDLVRYSEDMLGRWHAREAGRTFVLRASGDLSAVCVHTSLLDPILNNLLDNAVRYSPANTPITLSLERRGGFLILAVHDGGSALLLEDVPQLFEPFYRGREVQNTAGSGLGLYIAQACARRWGGTLGVDVVPGVGTTFSAQLPDTVS